MCITGFAPADTSLADCLASEPQAIIRTNGCATYKEKFHERQQFIERISQMVLLEVFEEGILPLVRVLPPRRKSNPRLPGKVIVAFP